MFSSKLIYAMPNEWSGVKSTQQGEFMALQQYVRTEEINKFGQQAQFGRNPIESSKLVVQVYQLFNAHQCTLGKKRKITY